MTPLTRGDRIAWTVKPHGERSSVHRAFTPTMTYCSRPIPMDRLLPTSTGQPCSRCQAMHRRAEAWRKQHPEGSEGAAA